MQNTPKTDPIPPSIKQHFYNGISPPNLSTDYDAIGFDADHCFVKYKVTNLLKHLVALKLRDMHEYSGYPEEIMEFDVESDDLQICMNYAVFDINKGILLKLGEGGKVLVGLKGRRKMDEKELEEAYGPGAKFEHIQWPVLSKTAATEEVRYITGATFFECCKGALFAMGVEMMEKGLVEKTYDQLQADVAMAIRRNYFHIGNDGAVLKASEFGHFFPELFKNPSEYIAHQPQLKQILSKFKEQGKFVFLATNSHWEFMELIMTATLGDDWRSSFDMVFAFCRKPLFWTNPAAKMYKMDKSDPKYHGAEVAQLENDSSITYLEGNSKLIEDYVAQKLGNNKQPEFVFFGDQYTSDVTIPQSLPHWHGIAIIEEMATVPDYKPIEESNPLNYSLDSNLTGYSKFWGEDHFIHDPANPVRNFFINEVQNRSRYALAAVKDVAFIMDF